MELLHNLSMEELLNHPNLAYHPSGELMSIVKGGTLDPGVVPLLNACLKHGYIPEYSCVSDYVCFYGYSPFLTQALINCAKVLPFPAIEFNYAARYQVTKSGKILNNNQSQASDYFSSYLGWRTILRWNYRLSQEKTLQDEELEDRLLQAALIMNTAPKLAADLDVSFLAELVESMPHKYQKSAKLINNTRVIPNAEVSVFVSPTRDFFNLEGKSNIFVTSKLVDIVSRLAIRLDSESPELNHSSELRLDQGAYSNRPTFWNKPLANRWSWHLAAPNLVDLQQQLQAGCLELHACTPTSLSKLSNFKM